MSKPQISINNKYDRFIALIDMDCFYCQVEEQLNPEIKGKPIAVVQYNAWRGGGIIAVNYPARAAGVTRHMRGDEAKEHCPEIELVKVPNIREKADLSKYRNAGKQVATVLQTFTPLLSRASVDEAYLDLTEVVQNRLNEMNKGNYSLQPNVLKNTFAVGYETIAQYVHDISERMTQPSVDGCDEWAHIPDDERKSYKKSDIKLLIASSIVSEIRAAVKEQTGYECSAGIAHNKVMAKLVCGLNKPNKQTILPLKHIPDYFSSLPLRKVQGLGGKFGEKICEDLGIQHMGELINFSKEELQRRYDERNGQWLYNIARGIDLEAVTPRLISKSIGCCKKFPGQNAIAATTTLTHWLSELATEITERLEQDELENNRRPKQMVVSFVQAINNVDVSNSRTVNLTAINVKKIVNDAMDILKKNTDKFYKSPDSCTILNYRIKFLGLNVSKFESTDAKKGNTIKNMFQRDAENRKNETKVDSTDGDSKTESNEIGKTDNNLENEATTSRSDDVDTTADKKDDTKNSFFLNYHRMRLQKQAEAERALKAEQENRLENNQSDETDETDEENTFQNDMLLEELEQNNQEMKQTNSPTPSTSARPDYMETYAEFYAPAKVEVPKVECSQCGKKVNEHEMQVHTDEHLAFQLTQEERVEFRNQLKRSNESTTPTAKKQKTSANNKVKSPPKKMPSIEKFLRKDDSMAIPSTSTADNVEAEKCAECGKMIPIVDLFEHMDYHAAKKLHSELMRSEAMANQANNNTIKNTSLSKSKKSKKNTSTKDKPNAMKNIASFFQSS